MIREAIVHLAQGGTLSTEEAGATMEEIMSGKATPSQMGAFLTALHLRPGGETVEEIVGLARVMREKSVRIPMDEEIATRAVDTCGTGGDGAGTLNISTAAAIVAAAAGAIVAKHGNRSATSKCGSADVLEVLGVRIDGGPEQAARSLQSCGFCFLFAPAYHPAMKHVGPIRREIGIRTVFNILGPLTNPAHVPYQVLGVAKYPLMRKMGESLLRLGCRHALIVHSEDGLDECSICAPTHICEVRADQELQEYIITPEEMDLPRASDPQALLGGDVASSATKLRKLLSNDDEDSPAMHMLCRNTGAALFACDHVPSIQEGVKLARATLREGKAKQKLAEIIEFSAI